MIRAVPTLVDLTRDPFLLPHRLEGQPIDWRDEWEPIQGTVCIRSGRDKVCHDVSRCTVCGEQRFFRPGFVDYTNSAHVAGHRDEHGNVVITREPERTWPVLAVLADRCGCGLSFHVTEPDR